MAACMNNSSGNSSCRKSSEQNHTSSVPCANNSKNQNDQQNQIRIIEEEITQYNSNAIDCDSECSAKEDHHDPIYFYFTSSTLFAMENCFASFDRDGDGCLNYSEFVVMCRALFRNDKNQPYPLNSKMLKNMFYIFDINQDGLIDDKEFEICWQKWVRKIVRPVSAIVVVDVQNDFISGSLAISNCPAKQNGEEVVEPINKLLDSVEFDGVFYSLDWHPENHISFVDNVFLRNFHESSQVQQPNDATVYDEVVFRGPPLTRQILWPRHCVQNSWGAKLHENLKVVEGSPFIYKGTNPDIDSYSAFWDNSKLSQTALISEIESKDITDVYVCGLAYDICVGATAVDAIEHGYRTILIEDASRGIDLDRIQATKSKILEAHGLIVIADQVKNMVQGRDRRPELGYKLALEIMKQRL